MRYVSKDGEGMEVDLHRRQEVDICLRLMAEAGPISLQFPFGVKERLVSGAPRLNLPSEMIGIVVVL